MDELRKAVNSLKYQKYIDNAIKYFFPGNCFDQVIVKLDIFDEKCAPIILSRLLGVVITLGSCFLLVPQILKIYFAGSARGISLFSQILGLIAAAGAAAYSYEKKFVFGQWGDSLFVSIQMTVIIMQILYHKRSISHSIVFMSVCWSTGMAINYHFVPVKVLEVIQALTIPIVSLAKGVQIVENYKYSSTGELSIISVGLQFVGCVARIFTSVQETGGDILIIAPFAVGTILNAIILGQIVAYTKGNVKKVEEEKKRGLIRAEKKKKT